jgi:hypothetical protein
LARNVTSPQRVAPLRSRRTSQFFPWPPQFAWQSARPRAAASSCAGRCVGWWRYRPRNGFAAVNMVSIWWLGVSVGRGAVRKLVDSRVKEVIKQVNWCKVTRKRTERTATDYVCGGLAHRRWAVWRQISDAERWTKLCYKPQWLNVLRVVPSSSGVACGLAKNRKEPAGWGAWAMVRRWLWPPINLKFCSCSSPNQMPLVAGGR